MCVCFLHFLFFLNAFFLFFLLFTTFAALHSNKDIFPFLISFFLFLLPMEAVKACANIWACLRTLMHACVRVCAGHQLLTSPPTTSLKNHKKCGEKSVWTQSINIQRWRSDPLVLPLSSIHVFSLSETSCRLKTHPSLWSWQHAWQWPHLCSYICRPSISPAFRLFNFPLEKKKKEKKESFHPPEENAFSHFQTCTKIGSSHPRLSVFQTQTKEVQNRSTAVAQNWDSVFLCLSV